MKKKECTYEGHEWFPHYGLAPHSHDLSGGSFIGSTRILSKDKWPSNFREDPDAPGCGIYECPGCFESPTAQESERE